MRPPSLSRPAAAIREEPGCGAAVVRMNAAR